MHLVTVHRLAADKLPFSLLIPLDGFDLLRDILGVHVVHDGPERGDIVGAGLHTSVNAVQQGNVTHAFLGEIPFHVMAGHDVVTSQTGQVLGDDHIDLFVLNVADHALKAWPVKIGAAPAVIDVSVIDGQVMLRHKFVQQRFLVGDTLGWSFIFIFFG